MEPFFDARDAELLDERQAAWEKRGEPRVGDFVTMPDGELRRFTHDWGAEHGIQTTWKGESGSFYLSGNGYASYSGGLEPAIPFSRIKPTDEVRDGWFWFFHHNDQRAHNGVHVTLPCRVYRVDGDDR
jgi:hypothetical protein